MIVDNIKYEKHDIVSGIHYLVSQIQKAKCKAYKIFVTSHQDQS